MEDIEGDVSMEKIVTDLNTLMNSSPSGKENKMIKVMKKIAQLKGSCNKCENVQVKEKHINEHTHDEHMFTDTCDSIFLSHHEDNSDECEVEIDPAIWNIFLSEDDTADELTDDEKKEILKLHKYFAHRNARKLWDNLLQPAGRMKGKKRLIQEFLDKCEVCKKYRRTPSRPKVGLPKAKDVNDVVSIDLKILKKSGNK